jgi:hypothetical protein
MDTDSLHKLKKKVWQVLILKYLVILLVITIAGIFFRISPSPGSQLKAYSQTFFFSGIVALLLSIVNDVVLRSEAEERAQMDRAEFASIFAKELFTHHADTVVTDDLLFHLMSSESRRAMVVRSLASLITKDPQLRFTVEQTYLEPIHRPPRFKSCRAISQLRNFSNKDQTYTWFCQQTLTTIVPVQDYRVFVCSDPNISALVESSTRASDFVILLSDFVPQEVRRWIEKKFVFQVFATDPLTARLLQLPVTKSFDLDELRRHHGCKNISDSEGAYCTLSWPEVAAHVQIEMHFECELSMKDPFFIWTLQDYAFIDLIEIDYAGIKSQCGRVSAIPYVRNPGCSIEHNMENGLFQMRIGGLAGPGEGAVLIFRPLSSENGC